MQVFVAGGTGVVGRAALQAMIEAGHRVRSSARGQEKAGLVRRLGAAPVDVDLDDGAGLRQAIAGSDAVVRLTTKIPQPMLKMRSPAAWRETNRLRTAGARRLVDAAIAARVPAYIHESITFVYADGGDQWLDEDARVDDGGTEILRAAVEGEREAARFSDAGGRGIVLRFGAFYGPDAPSTAETVAMARRRILVQIGPGSSYFSSVYVSDAARAVAAALGAPAGIYNVCDDTPVTFAEYLDTVAMAARAPRPRRLPVVLGPLVFGVAWKYLARSQRVSNGRLKSVSGWAPAVGSVADGWPMVLSRLGPEHR